MHPPSGMELAGLAGLLVAVPAVALLADSGRRHTGPARRAHLLLAAGGALVAGAALAGLCSAMLMEHAGPHAPDHRQALGSAVAVAMALGTLTLFAGTLMLPGSAETPGAALRHLLDGLGIAASVWFVGWVLVSEPTRILGVHTPYGCLPLLLPAAVATGAGALTTVLAMHAHRPRSSTVRVAVGVTLVTIAATALAGGICQGWTLTTQLGGLLLPAGLVVVSRAVRVADRPVQITGDVTQRATAYAFVPMLAMAGSAAYHLLSGGGFTALPIAAAGVEGFVLVTGQYLALVDVKDYARRLREREGHFRELAHTDPLTGLANRRGLLRALRTPAPDGRPRVLMGLDLDGFKNVNDMRGHDVGDAVLAEVAERLRGNVRDGDVAARLGGDEFAVLMLATADEATAAANRLLAVLCRPYEVDGGHTVLLSASVGIAATPAGDDTVDLMRDADLALRYAKQRGKNRVERYDLRYVELLRRNGTVENELRHAIERDQLRLVFQPVVDLPSVRPVGAEALLRWHHPELGAVRPAEFIPIAEESLLIARLGEWVLHQACRQLSRWLASGHDVWVSVNLSPRELHAADYAALVADVLRAHGVPAQRLVLEVTEHAMAADTAELVQRLGELRATGVRIALDDFGAGYSSLGQLRDLPVDILKIDRSLVAGPESPAGAVVPWADAGAAALLPAPGAAAPLVDVVVRLGHRLGLEVIAEGIGKPAQRRIVEEAGCRLGQGSLFGWGVPAEHLEAQLVSARSGVRPVPAQRGLVGGAEPQVSDATPADQDVGSVDSGREMRQA